MRPDMRIHSDECEHNDQWDSCERATSADLLAELRRGVESGTIKGEEVWWCETHGEVNVEQWCPGGPVAAALNRFDDVAEVPPCRIVSKLLIPVSDGGEDRP